MNKLLYIVRHAHREKPGDPKIDNGLSEKGALQAHALCKQLTDELSGHSLSFVSSPSRRCIETIRPLSEHFSQPIEALTMLLDQQEGENKMDFLGRLSGVKEFWEETAEDILVVCTHGDVIPELTEIILGSKVELAKSECLKVEQTETGPITSDMRASA